MGIEDIEQTLFIVVFGDHRHRFCIHTCVYVTTVIKEEPMNLRRHAETQKELVEGQRDRNDANTVFM